MSDTREFVRTECHFCAKPVAWLVYEDAEDASSDWMLACDRHKTAAFS